MKAGSRTWLRQLGLWTFAFGLAGFLLHWSLRATDWRQVGSLLLRADLTYIALPLCMATANLFLRALRWRLLLTSIGEVRPAAAFWATAAGYLGNNFLPARAGEAIRTIIVASNSKLGRPYVLATALSERVIDAIVLAGISATALLSFPAHGWLAGAARPLAILGCAGILTIALLPGLESVGKDMLSLSPLPPRVRAKTVHILEECLRALRAFHNRSLVMKFLGFTALIWLLDAIGSVITAKALGLEMSLAAAFLLIAGLGLGSALPSTPGYVGIYQFVAVSVLVPFGFTKASAIAYILLAQTLSWLVVGLWGSIGLARYSSLFKFKRVQSAMPIAR